MVYFNHDEGAVSTGVNIKIRTRKEVKIMKKNYDLYAELVKCGFAEGKSRWGQDSLTKEWSRKEGNPLQGNWVYHFKCEVVFNADHTTVTAYYWDGGISPFKAKIHLNEKRAFNAIKQTIKNHEFEI